MNFLHRVGIGLLFLCAMQFTSCKKGIDVNHTENKLVLLAEITAEDSAFIPVGKSSITRTGSSVNFEKMTTASVSLIDENNSFTRLRYNNAPDYLQNPTAVYTGKYTFDYNKTYTLNVTHPLLESITATATIPGPISISNVGAEDKRLGEKGVLVFDFTIHDQPTEKNYYIFEAVKQLVGLEHYFFWQGIRYDYDTPDGAILYGNLSPQRDIEILTDTIPKNQYIRLNLYTFDNKTDNRNLGSLDSSFHRIFITDSLFNGRAYKSFFAIIKNFFQAKTPEQTGQVIIKIKSVSKELYTYLLDYERYRNSFEVLPVQQLISPRGNVVNGLGVFGGVSKKQWIYYYDELK